MKISRVFFDSYGEPWITCDTDHPEAEAFGPRGAARRITQQGFRLVEVRQRGHLTHEDGGWLFLTPVGKNAEGQFTYEGPWSTVTAF